jgi:uncharacterized membrane protein YfcA
MGLEFIASLETEVVAVAFFVVAVMYSMVGQGGGSGYLAVMALAGFAPATLRPMALFLNVLVTTVGVVRFARAGGFRWRLFLPFAAASVPAAFAAGWLLELDPMVYRWVLGVILLYASRRLFTVKPTDNPETLQSLPIYAALAWGAGLGLIAGLTGVAGGIFLSPLVLLMGWATTQQTAAVSAAFILVNSIAGLLGLGLAALTGEGGLPVSLQSAAIWGGAVLAGGFIGSGIGARRLGDQGFRRVLAVVLLIAAIKMFLP